jgi:hypothetical protein
VATATAVTATARTIGPGPHRAVAVWRWFHSSPLAAKAARGPVGLRG